MLQKKSMICFYMFLLLFGALMNLGNEDTAKASTNQQVVIPDEAIRLRILANSDRAADQELKRSIRDEVNASMTEWVKDLTSIEQARTIIRAKLPEMNQIAKEKMKEQNIHQSVSVTFEKVSFPTKLYGNFVYPAGKYEAILITLGEGEGANWWCVLFPPLCFLDFSNGEAIVSPEGDGEGQETQQVEENQTKEPVNEVVKEEKEDEGEVKFFIVEWVTNLFS
ncbi:stage II sporulation protein R [Bacillus sp. NPDC077027]|uniref:stage II sporulation protein R n=1 Tax=Bacillus sp. NPDC077027 TaxID=3390548 RepID=UPI003CFC140E